jgi:hypothetical protein
VLRPVLLAVAIACTALLLAGPATSQVLTTRPKLCKVRLADGSIDVRPCPRPGPAVPEPGAAIAFAVGALLVGRAARKLR